MYYQHIVNKMKKLTIQFDWKNNEKWNKFIDLLNNNGFFPLDESENYQFLKDEAEIMFLKV